MGVQLFNRRYKLTVAPISGGPGLSTTDLRVQFHIEKTSNSAANKAEIKVYNLNEYSRGRVQQKNQGVVLEAGYTDLSKMAFAGVLLRVVHERQGTDVISVLHCRDGGLDLDADTPFHRSYAKGVSRLGVVRDIIEAMPHASEGELLAAGLGGSTPTRLAFAGSAKRAMDEVCRSWGCEWYILNGSVMVLARTTGTRTIPALYLSEKTGLVGSPSKTSRGAKWKSYLIADQGPGSKQQLDSELVKGYYKVSSCTLEGDTHGDPWHIEYEGVAL